MTTKKIVESYFQTNELSNIQIESYNHLIHEMIPVMIENSHLVAPIPNSQTSIVFNFLGAYMDKPHILDDQRNTCVIYPYEARMRDLSYETSVYTDIEITYIDNQSHQIMNSNVLNRHLLFKLPVMIGSELCNLYNQFELHNECEYDDGGYFIIKGKERVLVAQERINYNQIYVFKQKNTKYTYLSEIRSIKPDGDYSLLIQCKLTPYGGLFFQIPYVNKDVPFGIIFRVLNTDIKYIHSMFEDDKEVWNLIYRNLELYKHMNRDDAITYLCNQLNIPKLDKGRRYDYINQLFKDNLIPHIGLSSTDTEKANFLLLMTQKLLHVHLG